ncbi:MAG: HAMP domain-containing protein [Holosporales bacterium]|nr:HAMP domain-containing protein [Holosporales bacterium]
MNIIFSNILRKAKRRLPFYITVATVLCFYITYIILTKSKNSLNSSWLLLVLYADIVLISVSSLMVLNQIKRLLRLRSLRQKGNRFHKQIMILFSCGTIIPTSCIFVFAVLFFNVGIDNLFKSPVKNAIDNANHVASIYVNDMKITMENFVNGVGERIEKCTNGFIIDTEKIEEILEEETSRLKIEASVVMSANGYNFTVLAKSPFSLPAYLENLPREISHLEKGNVLSWETESCVMAAQMVNSELGVYLIASTGIDPIVLDHKHKTKVAVMEYSNLATQRTGLKFTFIAFFSVVATLLLLLSIFVGIIFANWILKPVNKLIIATKNVGSGSYDTQVISKKFNNEWDTLILTFNNMISKLEQQKQQLIISNKQNAWRDIARKIAHEIKNPLTPIQLSAERLKNRYRREITTSPEIFDSCVDTIIRQVSCIGNLVKEFSDFARMPAPKMEKSDIVRILKEVVFIQSNAHKEITFIQNYETQTFLCNFDQSQINQVMMNILQNAINAIVENSKSNTDEAIGIIKVIFRTKNNRMYITIEDDGPGFSEVAMERAMEPYYTTREAGSGLGLAIVYRIVNDHGGDIFLGRSENLSGARVTIEMPCYHRDDIDQSIIEEKDGV